jgi:hypothetical protein
VTQPLNLKCDLLFSNICFLSNSNLYRLHLVKRNVHRLTQTYLTLSLTDIAAAVRLPGGAAEVGGGCTAVESS